MQKFNVEVLETSARVMEIEAVSEEEAIKLVEDLYKDGVVVLDENDFQDVKVSVI